MKSLRMMLLAAVLALTGTAQADNLAVGSVTMVPGQTKEVAISLENPQQAYTAFQLELVLPEGVTMVRDAQGRLMARLDDGRKADHVLNAADKGGGVCRLMSFSLSNSPFAGTDGPLLHVTLHADERAAAIAAAAGIDTVPATEVDWATEYLAPDLAVHVVSGLDEAIAHINRYSTHHSEAIVAEDEAACTKFAAMIDAAAVYLNASTAFTDGGQFGLGAEIGISTQKLHVRGPFALEALTSYKYVVAGNGQVRA